MKIILEMNDAEAMEIGQYEYYKPVVSKMIVRLNSHYNKLQITIIENSNIAEFVFNKETALQLISELEEWVLDNEN